MAPCEPGASHIWSIQTREDISPYHGLSNLSPVLSFFISKPLLPCLIPEKKTYNQYCLCYLDTSPHRCISKENGRTKRKRRKTCKILIFYQEETPEHTHNRKTHAKTLTACSLVAINPSSKWKKAKVAC